jgi:hypothetical protein
MEIRRKTRILGAAVALAISAPAFAGEKIQIKGSTSVELPKPTHVLEDAKKNRMHEGPSGRADLGGGPPPISPFLNTNPQADKKFREMIDKKKNWIFVNPYEMQYDTKTEQFMKGEKGTGLYSHRLMQTEEKGIVERFLQEKNNNQREPEASRLDSNSNLEERRGSEKEDFRGSIRGNEEFTTSKKRPGDNSERSLGLPPVLDKNSPFEKNPYEQRLDRSPLSDGVLGNSVRLEKEAIYTPEERTARDAELSKIYAPRISGMTTTIGKDPLNTAFDPTRQEMTPFSSRRNDPLNSGRATLGDAASRNSPIFAGPPVGGSANGGLPERSSFDINARAAQASSFAPSVSAAPARSSSATANPIPFQLPRPVRKF